MSFAEHAVTEHDRRNILQQLSSRLPLDRSNILELEDRIYTQTKGNVHQYALLVAEEANRLVQQRGPMQQNSQSAPRMQQNSQHQNMPPRMPQNTSNMHSSLISQRSQHNPNSMYQQMPYPMQSRVSSYPQQHPQGKTPGMPGGTSMQHGMSYGNMNGQQQGMTNPVSQPMSYNQYPPSQSYGQSMSRNPYPPGQYPHTSGNTNHGGYPKATSQSSYTSYPSSTPASGPTNYPAGNISYRNPDRAPVVQQSAALSTAPIPPVTAPKRDNIEEFKAKAGDMKTKYLSKLITMIKDVDKIKAEDPKQSSESKKQYDEIQKKLTLLKTLITADFKPNSNFPPRKEILEAAEKQITMWISEWDKLLHNQPSGHEISEEDTKPTIVQAKQEEKPRQEEKRPTPTSTAEQHNNVQEPPQERINQPTAPPSNLNYQPGFSENDLNAILDLDNLDLPLMQDSIPGGNSMGNYNSDNPNIYSRDSRDSSRYMSGGYPQRPSNGDAYESSSAYGPPDTNNYSGEDQREFSSYNYPSNYQDNYSNPYPMGNYRSSSYGHHEGRGSGPYPSNFQSPDDKSNINSFGDLECNTEYLQNDSQAVLGKRKQTVQNYFDADQPAKYAKMNPL